MWLFGQKDSEMSFVIPSEHAVAYQAMRERAEKAEAERDLLRVALRDVLERYAGERDPDEGWNSRTTPNWFVEYAALAEGLK